MSFFIIQSLTWFLFLSLQILSSLYMYTKGGFIQLTRSVLMNLDLEVRMISLRLWILQRLLLLRKKRRKLIDLVFSRALEGVDTKYSRIQQGLVYVYSPFGHTFALKIFVWSNLGPYLLEVFPGQKDEGWSDYCTADCDGHEACMKNAFSLPFFVIKYLCLIFGIGHFFMYFLFPSLCIFDQVILDLKLL